MINQQAYNSSINVLLQAATSKGFVAAVTNIDNYKRVWTRDGALCVIAAVLSKNETLIDTAKKTIETIFKQQHPTGFMPSNVEVASKNVSYGGAVGRADNPSWAVIALCFYTLHTTDKNLQKKYSKQVEKCFAILNAWEFNGKHLIYTPQSGDWADEYIHHGYTLFNQLLRVWALQLAGKVYNKEAYCTKAKDIIKVIEQNFWVGNNKNLYSENLKHLLPKEKSNYWLLGFNPSRVYTYFDLQANALALYLNIGTKAQQKTVIDFINKMIATKPNAMLPSFYPTIKNKDADMQLLQHNYAYEFRNKPNQFHNGGLWAVWNGFLAMCLQQQNLKKLTKNIIVNIHNANEITNSFNECIDGKTLKPCGINFCTWSAAGAIIAEQSF